MRWRVILSNLSFVAVCRRPEVISTLRHPNAVTDGVSRGLNPDSVADLDRDALAEAATWFLSLGWLDRPMFESTWTSLLAACTPPSGDDGLGDEENPFANSKEVGFYHRGQRVSPLLFAFRNSWSRVTAVYSGSTHSPAYSSMPVIDPILGIHSPVTLIIDRGFHCFLSSCTLGELFPCRFE